MEGRKSFDDFWLDIGQELVTDTVKNLNVVLKNYNTFLNALTGFYLIGGVTATLFVNTKHWWVYLAYILPVAVVQLAKYYVNVGEQVSLVELDLRSPLSINDAHNEIVEKFNKTLNRARFWIGLATFSVVLGASVAIYFVNEEARENATSEKEATLKQKKDDAEFEIYKTFKKGQLCKITQTGIKLKVEAKFAEEMQIELVYELMKDNKETYQIIIIPPFTDFLLEIDSVQTLKTYKLIK